MVKIIDVAVDTTKHLDAFKRTSPELDAIIRYDDRFVSGDWKQVHLSEVKAIKATGLKLGIVYEDAGATPATFSEQTGYLSASYSRRMAKARGQPDSSAIYFAVDFDATRRQITSRIIPYFRGVERALLEANNLPKLRMGAYCSGMCAEMLRAQFSEILIWITCSLGFAGSRQAVRDANYDLWQQKCDTTLAGVDCDYDVAKNPDWGWFVPWENLRPPSVPPPPPQIVHNVKWLQKVLAKARLYHGKIDGDVGPLTAAAMIAYVEKHEAASVATS